MLYMLPPLMSFHIASAPFYTTHVHMPTPDEVQTKICNNPRFWPYFKDVIGALDRSHIMGGNVHRMEIMDTAQRALHK